MCLGTRCDVARSSAALATADEDLPQEAQSKETARREREGKKPKDRGKETSDKKPEELDKLVERKAERDDGLQRGIGTRDLTMLGQ